MTRKLSVMLCIFSILCMSSYCCRLIGCIVPSNLFLLFRTVPSWSYSYNVHGGQFLFFGFGCLLVLYEPSDIRRWNWICTYCPVPVSSVASARTSISWSIFWISVILFPLRVDCMLVIFLLFCVCSPVGGPIHKYIYWHLFCQQAAGTW